MIQRLSQRAHEAGLTNVDSVLRDATKRQFEESEFDLVFLVTTLGEIPNREAVLAECFRALKPGGILSVTEIFGDPHYQSRSTVKRLAENAGFLLDSCAGHWWFFTQNFVKSQSTGNS